MTWVEVNNLISQIQVVSTTFQIKEILGSMFIKNYRSGTEFEEFKSDSEREEADLKNLQYLALKAGLIPPKG